MMHRPPEQRVSLRRRALPKFAHIAAEVVCPRCGRDVTIGGRIAVQWGYCSVPLHGTGPAYRIGEAVRWRCDRNGAVGAWVYFPDGGGNIGDPAFTDVLVRESEYDIRDCPGCGAEFAGIGVLIRGGVIQKVQVYTEGLPAAEVSVYCDGQLRPRPDWDDHSMRMVHDSREPRG